MTALKEMSPPRPVASGTTLFSIVVSMAIIASISVIGITLAYMLSYSSDVDGKCINNVLAFEQQGYYANLEGYKAASASCIK
jgi:competence protein ComGF